MLTVYLVRHGETDYNAEGRLQGHLPIPLNDRGRAQAKRLARKFQEIQVDAIYSSDLPRAVQTAEIVAELKGLPIHTDARFRERSLGHWEGRLYSEVERELEEKNWISHTNGESLENVRHRVMQALSEFTKTLDGKSILLVAHGGSCHGILSTIAGPDYGKGFLTWHNTAVSILRWEERNGWSVVDLYDDEHLEGDGINFAEAISRT